MNTSQLKNDDIPKCQPHENKRCNKNINKQTTKFLAEEDYNFTFNSSLPTLMFAYFTHQIISFEEESLECHYFKRKLDEF